MRTEKPLFLEEWRQELRQFPVESAIERIRFLHGVVLVACKVAGAFPADVYADDFVVCGETGDDIFECCYVQRTLIPVGGRVGGGEGVLVDGEVDSAFCHPRLGRGS